MAPSLWALSLDLTFLRRCAQGLRRFGLRAFPFDGSRRKILRRSSCPRGAALPKGR